MTRTRALAALSTISLLLAAVLPAARAAQQTIVGTQFDITYDDTQLGLFSAPTLVGNTLLFTFNSFVAQSLNGAGVVSTNSTIAGLVLTAKNGYSFDAFSLAEFGDYTLSGAGSQVQVQGQLRAFNLASSLTTQTTNNLLVSPLTPLTFNDGLNHDWTATARIDSSTAAVPSPFGGGATNVILSSPNAVGMAIENRLTAYTDASTPGLRQAFVEKKFAGVQLDVITSPVPVPPSLWLMAAGLGVLTLWGRRPAR